MVTKKMILRPTSVEISNSSLITFYPSDTLEAEAHLLVNEEVPDDDSTYISITGAGAKVNYYFTFIKPALLTNVLSIKIFAREKLESGSNPGSSSFYIGNNSIGVGTLEALNTTDYTTRTTQSFNSSDLEAFKDVTENTKIYFSRALNSNSSKASPLRTSQVYLEITYEVPHEFYIKNNNIWIPFIYSDICYRKQQNSWVKQPIVEISNKKYQVMEVE